MEVGSLGKASTGAKAEVMPVSQIKDKQMDRYLSELRPVTIVFVNLIFKDHHNVEVISEAIQDACVHINSALRIFHGQINKVFMFDKVGAVGIPWVQNQKAPILCPVQCPVPMVLPLLQGCSFLCVFGFPGEKVPNERSNALESAVNIFDFCSQDHKIQ